MISEKGIVLDRLWFSSIPLEYFNGIKKGLSLDPHIGLQKIEFLDPVMIKFKVKRSWFSAIEREPGSRVAFYSIAHPCDSTSDRLYYKIGSSSVNSVLSRVYSQAPVVGTIALVAIVNERLNTEVVDKEIANELREKLRVVARSSRGRIGCDNSIMPYYLNLLNITKEVNATREHKLLTILKSISDIMHEIINRKFGQKLAIVYPSPVLQFTPLVKDEDIDYIAKLDETRLSDFGQLVSKERNSTSIYMGELVILHNALCILKTENKHYITTCDRVEYNLLIELIR